MDEDNITKENTTSLSMYNTKKDMIENKDN